jgi:hypothetical protein
MGWDPVVLRKYNTTGHFRLLNQVRAELKGNPLIRPEQGETVGAANRSKSLIRALEVRPQSGSYARRSTRTSRTSPPASQAAAPTTADEATDSGMAASFRDRLSAIEMR